MGAQWEISPGGPECVFLPFLLQNSHDPRSIPENNSTIFDPVAEKSDVL
jgi:hypothetical protein